MRKRTKDALEPPQPQPTKKKAAPVPAAENAGERAKRKLKEMTQAHGELLQDYAKVSRQASEAWRKLHFLEQTLVAHGDFETTEAANLAIMIRECILS